MAVDSVTASQASPITGAIRQASQSTGISFQYLLTTAKIESGLNPSAQATTSSAKGLYQFIEQTWLGTMKQDGASIGLGAQANAITQGSDGRYEVADPAQRDAIMKLRSDPDVSAMMAGALSRANAFQLTGQIGRRPTEGELYIAHFLGPDGASKMINATDARPDANAAKMFPAAANANRSIFYDNTGNARSVSDVYAKLTGKFDNARTVAVASLSGGSAPAAAASAEGMSLIPIAKNPTANNAVMSTPDTAGVTQALAAANNNVRPVADTKPLFQAMFNDRGEGGVSSTVANLWTPGANAADTAKAAADAVVARPQGNRGLDLFSDGLANVRGIFSGKAS